MQEKNNSSDSVSTNRDTHSQSEFAPKVEFVYGEEKEDVALVFEHNDKRDEKTSKTPRVNFEAVTEVNESEKSEVLESDRQEVKEENISPKSAIYVPRFTEVSENYRMADIPPQNRVKSEHSAVAAEPKSTAADVKEKIDPTAEIYKEDKSNAVPVKVGKNKDTDVESSSRVFKFVKNELPREATVEEDERFTETVYEPAAVEVEVPVKKAEPTEYKIPDPVDSDGAVVAYASSASLSSERVLEDAPKGVGDRLNSKDYKGKEYTAYLQRDSFKDRFIDKKMSICVRLFASVLLIIMLVVSEAMFASGVNIPEKMNLSDIPGAMALLDFQFVLCLYLLAIPETVNAIRLLFKKQITTDLFLTVQLIALSVYTVLMVVHSPRRYVLFGLIFGISAVGVILAAYFKQNADMKSFLCISQNVDKTVIDIKPTRMLERENSALDGAVEEHKSKIARNFKSMFVSDFFHRSEKDAEKNATSIVILSFSLVFALVLATVAFFVCDGAVSAITSFSAVIMLACPVVSIIAHKLLFCHAEMAVDREGSAVIGEKALLDYSGIDVVTFEDTEVFSDEDVSLQRIILYGNSDNLSKALYQMSALFMNVGGPLNLMFSDSLDRKCSPAHIISVENGGICGEIDGHRVLAGTLEYMVSKGAAIPGNENRSAESNRDSTKIMYAAEDGVVYAKFYIRYSFSEEFSMLLPILEDYGITPLVYTRDPNITRDLITTLTAGNDKIRVLKKNDINDKENVVYRKVSCGVVTTAGRNEAVNTILVSKKYMGLMSRFSRLEFAAAVIGAIIGSVVSIGGFVSLPSFVPALWHVATCSAMYIFSKITFRTQGK